MHAKTTLLLACLLTAIPPTAGDDGTTKPLTCPYPTGNVVFCVTYGELAFDRPVFFVDVVDGIEVAGYVDRYRWETGSGLTGSDLVVPCVTLVVDGAEHNPCADLGLTFDSRVEAFTRVTPSPQASFRTLEIYEATLDAMVLGFGADDEEILAVDPCQVQGELGLACLRYDDPLGSL
jgi:hypothetical protein